VIEDAPPIENGIGEARDDYLNYESGTSSVAYGSIWISLICAQPLPGASTWTISGTSLSQDGSCACAPR